MVAIVGLRAGECVEHGILGGGVNVACVQGGAVAEQVSVGVDDHVVVGMGGDDLSCPCQHAVIRAVVQIQEEVIQLTDLQGLVGVVGLAVVASLDLILVLDLGGVLVELVGTCGVIQIVVTANEAVGDDTVELADVLHGVGPLGVGVVLGNIAETHHVLNILGLLILHDPVVDVAHLIGVGKGEALGVTHHGDGVGVIGYGSLICKETVVGSLGILVGGIVAVAAHVGDGLGGGACQGGQVVGYQQVILVKSGCLGIGGDLRIGANVAVHGHVLDLALEILGIGIAEITADDHGVGGGGEVGAAASDGLLQLAAHIALQVVGGVVKDDGKVNPLAGVEVDLIELPVVNRAALLDEVHARVAVLMHLNAEGVGGGVVVVAADDTTTLGSGEACGELDGGFNGQRGGGQGIVAAVDLIGSEGHTVVVGSEDGHHSEGAHQQSQGQ